MHIRLFSITVAALICVTTTLPAYAQVTENSSNTSSQNNTSVAVTDSQIGYEQSDKTQLNTTTASIGVYPFEIKHETFGGQPVIIKSFKANADADPQSLIEAEFEESGYHYSVRDILVNEPEMKQETKVVAKTLKTSTKDNEDATVMSGFPSIIDFNEDGFQGQLLLDRSSILSTVTGTESYSYPIKKLVSVPNLNNNDYAYLEKDLNGLILQSANWVPLAETQRADVLLPSAYNSQALYTGIGYGTKATGYNNSAVYTGTVTRTYEGSSVYSIIYQGVAIQKESSVPWGGIGIGLLIIAAVGCVVWLLITKFIPNYKNKRKSSGPNVPVAMP